MITVRIPFLVAIVSTLALFTLPAIAQNNYNCMSIDSSTSQHPTNVAGSSSTTSDVAILSAPKGLYLTHPCAFVGATSVGEVFVNLDMILLAIQKNLGWVPSTAAPRPYAVVVSGAHFDNTGLEFLSPSSFTTTAVINLSIVGSIFFHHGNTHQTAQGYTVTFEGEFPHGSTIVIAGNNFTYVATNIVYDGPWGMRTMFLQFTRFDLANSSSLRINGNLFSSTMKDSHITISSFQFVLGHFGHRDVTASLNSAIHGYGNTHEILLDNVAVSVTNPSPNYVGISIGPVFLDGFCFFSVRTNSSVVLFGEGSSVHVRVLSSTIARSGIASLSHHDGVFVSGGFLVSSHSTFNVVDAGSAFVVLGAGSASALLIDAASSISGSNSVVDVGFAYFGGSTQWVAPGSTVKLVDAGAELVLLRACTGCGPRDQRSLITIARPIRIDGTLSFSGASIAVLNADKTLSGDATDITLLRTRSIVHLGMLAAGARVDINENLLFASSLTDLGTTLDQARAALTTAAGTPGVTLWSVAVAPAVFKVPATLSTCGNQLNNRTIDGASVSAAIKGASSLTMFKNCTFITPTKSQTRLTHTRSFTFVSTRSSLWTRTNTDSALSATPTPAQTLSRTPTLTSTRRGTQTLSVSLFPTATLTLSGRSASSWLTSTRSTRTLSSSLPRIPPKPTRTHTPKAIPVAVGISPTCPTASLSFRQVSTGHVLEPSELEDKLVRDGDLVVVVTLDSANVSFMTAEVTVEVPPKNGGAVSDPRSFPSVIGNAQIVCVRGAAVAVENSGGLSRFPTVQCTFPPFPAFFFIVC